MYSSWPVIEASSLSSELRSALVQGLNALRDTPLEDVHELRPAAALIRRQAMGTAERIEQDDPGTYAGASSRIADQLESLADSITMWLNLGQKAPIDNGTAAFKPAVTLEPGGKPLGVAPVARGLAAVEHAKGWRRHISPFLRSPLQTAVAAAITVPVADAINPQRYYWGLVGVVLSMFGPSTTTERVRKTVQRVVGTAVGAALGIILIHLTGHGHPWTILTIIVLGIGISMLGVQNHYMFFAVFLTASFVQLYGLTTPNNKIDWLLAQRVFDNGVGMLIGTICIAVLFPLSRRQIIRKATQDYLVALEQMINLIATRWATPQIEVRLRGAARGVDGALHRIRGAMRPSVQIPLTLRSPDADHLLAQLAMVSGHARALAAAADVDVDPHLRDKAVNILTALGDSLQDLQHHVTETGKAGHWVGIGPLIDELDATVRDNSGPGENALLMALRELTALDEALASVARSAAGWNQA